MKRTRLVLSVTLAAIIGAVVATALPTLAAPEAPPIVPGTAQDALVESDASINLSRTGGERVTIVAMTLPAGSWVLTAETTLVNFGPATFARCQIIAGGQQIASGATTVGDETLPAANARATFVAGRGLLGSVRRQSSFRAALRCLHDESTPSGQPAPYVDPGAVLWAHRSGNLFGTTT